MKFRKALLIYNGEAGQKDLDKTLGACVPVIASQVEELVLLATKKPGHAKEICQERGEAVDAIFILGGDGTVHEVINGLGSLDKRPVIGILPNGTCNDFSRALNIPQDIKKAAQALFEGEIVDVDAARVNDAYFLNFWGTGIITETSSNIEPGEKRILGKISYYLSAIRTISKSEAFSFTLSYEGKQIEGEAVMILVLNGSFIGTRPLPVPHIQINDGLLDVVVIKNSSLSAFRELLSLKRSWTPQNEEDTGIIYFQTRRIKIETAERIDADTDGEVYLQTPADITSLKQHFKMISHPV
ncbi:YegS/Rv2252/BmrU family lipid kinase [Peribacillus kribbensis]|uniref:YegS/Rv2252/BmrU family lipid kinase n=1 Tax=Peribacillus kribbensis TaxID=356658 RepID=UPI0004293A80|nr:YegS/Rv2252/BmrU family lipid kinase [Peribacillus kribbensis]